MDRYCMIFSVWALIMMSRGFGSETELITLHTGLEKIAAIPASPKVKKKKTPPAPEFIRYNLLPYDDHTERNYMSVLSADKALFPIGISDKKASNNVTETHRKALVEALAPVVKVDGSIATIDWEALNKNEKLTTFIQNLQQEFPKIRIHGGFPEGLLASYVRFYAKLSDTTSHRATIKELISDIGKNVLSALIFDPKELSDAATDLVLTSEYIDLLAYLSKLPQILPKSLAEPFIKSFNHSFQLFDPQELLARLSSSEEVNISKAIKSELMRALQENDTYRVLMKTLDMVLQTKESASSQPQPEPPTPPVKPEGRAPQIQDLLEQGSGKSAKTRALYREKLEEYFGKTGMNAFQENLNNDLGFFDKTLAPAITVSGNTAMIDLRKITPTMLQAINARLLEARNLQKRITREAMANNYLEMWAKLYAQLTYLSDSDKKALINDLKAYQRYQKSRPSPLHASGMEPLTPLNIASGDLIRAIITIQENFPETLRELFADQINKIIIGDNPALKKEFADNPYALLEKINTHLKNSPTPQTTSTTPLSEIQGRIYKGSPDIF